MLHVNHWYCLFVGGPVSNWENESKHNTDKTESLQMEVMVLVHEKRPCLTFHWILLSHTHFSFALIIADTSLRVPVSLAGVSHEGTSDNITSCTRKE